MLFHTSQGIDEFGPRLEKECMDDVPLTLQEQWFNDVYTNTTSYKVTITFHRKKWLKSRAFRLAYVELRRILDKCDVTDGMFFLELQKSGYPHLHGIIKWKNAHYECKDHLMSRLVSVFGQSKVYEYKPEDFKEDDRKYPSWFHYMCKDFWEVKEYRDKYDVEFPITAVYGDSSIINIMEVYRNMKFFSIPSSRNNGTKTNI